MESVRRISRVITVGNPGAIVPLDFQLPTEATQCLGLQTTVTGLFPRVKSVVDFGEISISFNGKQNHSFHHLVSYENANARHASSIKCGLLPLSTVLTGGSITGFYRDLERQNSPFMPYQVRINFSLRTS